MKNIFLLICGFIFISISLKAQEEKKDFQKRPVGQKKFDWKKLQPGGSIGLQFGDVTIIDLSPTVAYPVTEKIALGVGATYNYIRFKGVYNFSYNRIQDLSLSSYGGRMFGRYFIFPSVFAHAEYEVLNVEYYRDYDLKTFHTTVGSPLIGAGYAQRFGMGSYFFLMLLYNLNYTIYSPYPSPYIFRVGMSIGL